MGLPDMLNEICRQSIVNTFVVNITLTLTTYNFFWFPSMLDGWCNSERATVVIQFKLFAVAVALILDDHVMHDNTSLDDV
ncbi:hypothetical protein BDA99DRAFT_318452 [Phascolomyces articulosus]|uniref:Uncharacterized protein n=1 Tax=Phascolomyces articulosus TaxID=60185 RepID=A0AAD5PG56_9FUNG|nr:hypothetical protein BDA99DRAFT_318452 [Phascolomyces articulosus]